ncbi:transposase [Colwellia piezophila]|uniref:transposase n=1 Tax=Colwellia piezophila TaxID=211668 RepID=UPI00035C644C|nr:transposase [Colwellia piezophila]
MAIPRKRQISLTDTQYYHCVSRCVRRAYLCGEDRFSGISYEHRRGWVEDKLLSLTQIFAIDVCAYAVMSNHTHIVLFVDVERAKSWSMIEALERWHLLFKGTLLTHQYLRGDKLITPLQQIVAETAAVYRARLMDISWFMRILNETIARRANIEDNCTGRFWEGRFKSQALLDEAALAACMVYVDLNPVRANIANTPETSAYTSIQQRIKAAIDGKQPEKLADFVGNPKKYKPTGLPFELSDYILLVDLTGRCIRADKTGYIIDNLLNILNRLKISPDNWFTLTSSFTKCFHGAVGSEHALTQYCQHLKLKRCSTLSVCKKLLA